jgi:hypothetical protein
MMIALSSHSIQYYKIKYLYLYKPWLLSASLP